MAKNKSGRRAAVTIVVILIILALPWIYLQFAASPWDDYRTLAAENEYPFDFADFSPAGELTVRLDKADLYSLLLEYYPPEKLLAEADLTGLVKVELEELGFSLAPEEARVNLRLKALGFLHLPAQLRCRLEEAGDGLLLTPETVYVGPLLHISAARLAERLGKPELAEPNLLSPTDYGAEGVTLRTGEDCALLSLTVPSMLPDLLDLNVMPMALLFQLYGVKDPPPAVEAALGDGFASAFRAAIREGTARELLMSYLALGEVEVTELLEEYGDQVPAGFLPDPEEIAARRQAALDQLAEAQG